MHDDIQSESSQGHRLTAAQFATRLRLDPPVPERWLAWAHWAQSAGLETAKLAVARQARGGGGPVPAERAVNVDAKKDAWTVVVQLLAEASGLPVPTVEGLGLYVGVLRRAPSDSMKADYEELRRRLDGRESEVAAGIAEALRADEYCALVAREAIAAWDARQSALTAGSARAEPGRDVVSPEAVMRAAEALARKKATSNANKRRRRANARLNHQQRPLTAKQRQTVEVVEKHGKNIAAAARELRRDPTTVRENFNAACAKLGRPSGSQRTSVGKAQRLPTDKRGADALADGDDRRRQGFNEG